MRVKSTNRIFARAYWIVASSSANFTLAHTVTPGESIMVPLEPANVWATTTGTFTSPVFSAALAPGTTTVTRDVTFTGFGTIEGALRRTNGAIFNGSYSLTVRQASQSAGGASVHGANSYLLPVVPPGLLSMHAQVTHPQGWFLFGTGAGTAIAGQRVTIDTMLPALGSVAGTFTTETGTPIAGAEVELAYFQFQLRTFTTATGQYTFVDVPEGTYTVTATHPPTSVEAFAPVTVVGDTTITQNLALPGNGHRFRPRGPWKWACRSRRDHLALRAGHPVPEVHDRPGRTFHVHERPRGTAVYR